MDTILIWIVIGVLQMTTLIINVEQDNRLDKLEQYTVKVNLKKYEKRTDYTNGIVVIERTHDNGEHYEN